MSLLCSIFRISVDTYKSIIIIIICYICNTSRLYSSLESNLAYSQLIVRLKSFSDTRGTRYKENPVGMFCRM